MLQFVSSLTTERPNMEKVEECVEDVWEKQTPTAGNVQGESAPRADEEPGHTRPDCVRDKDSGDGNRVILPNSRTVRQQRAKHKQVTTMFDLRFKLCRHSGAFL